MKWAILFCVYTYGVFAKHELYDGYVVYQVYPNNLDDVKFVNEVANEMGLDIWQYATINRPGEIFVSEPHKAPFEDALQAGGIAYKITIENIRELLEMEDQKFAEARKNRNSNSLNLTFDQIYTYDQVTEYMAYIARTYPNVATLHTAATSFEGRHIEYLLISSTGFVDRRKPVIFLQSLLHAREWVTLPVTLYAIHKLVVDVTESDILNNFDWIVMPVANPDGYIWSHTNARFWRKNRRNGIMVGNLCVGVDLNRNFNVNWGTASSSLVCSDTYHGSMAESESETRAVALLINGYRDRMIMYSDMHSAGSMILYGWGNGTLVQNALTLHVACVTMAQAIDRVKWASKPNYVCGNIVNVLGYTASGGSSDYGQIAGIPYSFTYELPALLGAFGTNRFLVDPEFIEQAAVETWQGIIAGARSLIRSRT